MAGLVNILAIEPKGLDGVRPTRRHWWVRHMMSTQVTRLMDGWTSCSCSLTTQEKTWAKWRETGNADVIPYYQAYIDAISSVRSQGIYNTM